ncbi:hypothetical protein D6779_06180 [Candidatus Parcubacteria bacterium]|nr:MAG: hypothetical protein D6779_06180 [Candidatus Parcubacteria bacterium]
MISTPGVYIPLGSDGYELCHPVDPADFERIDVLINGTTRQANWKPIQMQMIREDEGKKLLPSDSPWLGSNALIFRSSVLDVLGALLQQYGEVLPLSCPGVDLWIYNPTNVIDALDESSSSVLRFDNGRIMMIERYAFRPNIIAENEIFKIPSLRVSPTFVSHRFVERWKKSGLTGLEFKKVWTAQKF